MIITRPISPIKVLAIDDDPAMTELLALLLRPKGFDIHTCNSGEVGIDMVRKISPHVVILDLMMPTMDGWKVCSSIRTFSQVPILILSALDGPGSVATALDAGADDYLVKPVPAGMLVAHLHTLTRRTLPEHSPSREMAIQPSVL